MLFMMLFLPSFSFLASLWTVRLCRCFVERRNSPWKVGLMKENGFLIKHGIPFGSESVRCPTRRLWQRGRCRHIVPTDPRYIPRRVAEIQPFFELLLYGNWVHIILCWIWSIYTSYLCNKLLISIPRKLFHVLAERSLTPMINTLCQS